MGGLAGLMGILGGAGAGALHGYDAAVADEQKAAQLAEQKRQFDESKVVDLSALPPEIKASLGLSSASKLPAALAPAVLGAAEKAQATRDAAVRAERVGAALENNTFSTAGKQPVSASAPGMLAPETRVADPEIAALGPIAKAGEADKAMATLNEILKNRLTPPKLTTQVKEVGGPEGSPNEMHLITYDQNGNLVKTTNTNLQGPHSKSALDAAISDYYKNPTPEGLARINTLSRPQPAPPGSTLVPTTNIAGIKPPAAAGGPIAPSTPIAPGSRAEVPNQNTIRPVYQVPAIPNDAEVEKGGMRIYMINTLDKIAKQAENMPQLDDARMRSSLQVRGYIQGNTPFQTLTPEEQRWVTLHENLRTQLINLQTGLGSFRSPEMQKKYEEIMGRYWSAGTPERIRELMTMVREQGEGVAQAAQQSRRIPIQMPNPSTTPTAPAATEQPWTDLGNGVRIRMKR